MKHFLLVTLLIALSSHANAASISNLVINGSFENAKVKTHNWRVFKSIAGWTTAGSGVEIRDNVAGKAYEGDHFAELDSYANSSIFQTLTTQSNQAYTLSFFYSPRIKQAASTNGINVAWNGVNVNANVITAAGGKTNNWLQYSFIVYGSGLDILSFSAAGKSDSLGGNIDAISVTEVLNSELSAVPVPAALFLFAPILLGFMILIRNKEAA